jgi:hypothetical protein
MEGLNQSVQKDAVKTTVAKLYAILVRDQKHTAVNVWVSKLCGAFFPTLFGVSYSGVEAPAARTQGRAGDPTSPQVRQIPWKIGRHLS